MRKMILAALAALCMVGVASANTVTPLQYPSDMPKGNQPSGAVCMAVAFNADDSSYGTCTSVSAGACSGRACQPTYTSIVFAAVWDKEGNLIGDGYCGTAVTHRPIPPKWSYAAGFDASTCYFPKQGTPQVLVYDPKYGFEHWFGYVATSADGAYELLTYGTQGYINQF